MSLESVTVGQESGLSLGQWNMFRSRIKWSLGGAGVGQEPGMPREYCYLRIISATYSVCFDRKINYYMNYSTERVCRFILK